MKRFIFLSVLFIAGPVFAQYSGSQEATPSLSDGHVGFAEGQPGLGRGSLIPGSAHGDDLGSSYNDSTLEPGPGLSREDFSGASDYDAMGRSHEQDLQGLSHDGLSPERSRN